MISRGERYYFPGNLKRDEKVTERKDRFAALNEFVRKRHGWLVSVPGEREVTMECLPGSSLPDALRDLGYADVTQIGSGERILPAAIVERFGRGARGELELLTAGSTEKAIEVREHAGIVRVLRFAFEIP